MAFKCMTGRAPGYLSAQFRRCNVTVRKSRNSSFKNHLAAKDSFIIEGSPYEILYQMILNFGNQ